MFNLQHDYMAGNPPPPTTGAVQNTGKHRKNVRDKFYTNPDVAKQCIADIIKTVRNAKSYLWVEPAAGNGAFFNNVPPKITKIGLDLEPKTKNIQKQDFFEWRVLPTGPSSGPHRPILVFGNPPFGKQSSLAKAFIKHSAQFADVIAFILPKSFRKPSVYKVFDAHFHRILDKPVGPDAFVLNGEKYDVPCVFQIWKRSKTPRRQPKKTAPKGFEYLKDHTHCDIVVRRVGGKAGRCELCDKNKSYNPNTNIFMRILPPKNTKTHLKKIVDKINTHKFPSGNTVGPRSVSKNELTTFINTIV